MWYSIAVMMTNQTKDKKMTKEERSQIAMTILEQLGGNRFMAMTGAKNLAFGDNGSLQFKIGRNAGKITNVVIELGASDLYTVKFYKIRAAKCDLVKELDGVYADQLCKVFTSVTGMATSL